MNEENTRSVRGHSSHPITGFAQENMVTQILLVLFLWSPVAVLAPSRIAR